MKEKSKRKQQETRKSHPLVVPIVLLFIIGIAAYWNSFDVPLVFDDLLSIQRNAGVRFGDYFSQSLLWSRSLLYLTFAANYYFHEQDVWGYHLVSLIFHLLNGILVFLIARHIFSKLLADERSSRNYALFAAACFVAHPIQTESVTYISSRSELVSLFFYAIAFLIFIKLPEEKIGFRYSLLITGVFLLALGGKETAITLPAALILYDYVFISKTSFRPMLLRWRFYLTFIVGAVLSAYYIATRLLVGAIGEQPGHLSYWKYTITQPQVIVEYIRMILLPYGQSLDHDVIIPDSAFEVRVIIPVLIILGLLGVSAYLRKAMPIVLFGVWWFFITLSPTSSFVPILDVMFEHRVYLPMAGLCLVFPALLEFFIRFIRERSGFRWSFQGASTAIVILLVVLTVARNHVWREETRLWADAVEKAPYKARPYNALSMAYFKVGDYQKAVEVSELAIQRNPEVAAAFEETLGNMYLKLGRLDKAVEYFKKIAERGQQSLAFNNVGVTYQHMLGALRQQRQTMSEEEFTSRQRELLKNASEAFQKSLSADPEFLWALHSFIYVEFEAGNGDRIRQEAEAKLAEGEDFKSLYTVAMVYFLQNRFPEALPYFERAANKAQRIEGHKLFFYQFGYTLERTGALDRAIEQYTMAVRLDPIFLEAYYNMALVHVRRNDLDAAVLTFKEALRCDPIHTLTHLELAKVYVRQAKTSQAREHLQAVLSREPGNAPALQLMQKIGS